MKHRKLLAANWKMNTTVQQGQVLFREIEGMLGSELQSPETAIVIAAPFTHLHALKTMQIDARVALSGQNLAAFKDGAYTGEISATMLKNLGCNYVIIGHSERRTLFNEQNPLLIEKTKLALEAGLKVIFCIGENEDERAQDIQEEVIAFQMQFLFDVLDAQVFSNIIIAYEPVWAIGTGKTASAEQAQAMHAFIRSIIAEQYSKELAENCTILYGGSCNEQNAKELFAQEDIDGGLIGGASLKSRSFVNIAKQLFS